MPKDRTSAAYRHRSVLKLLTLANAKTPKGEGGGYLTATLYLLPHTEGGGATLCPYSTEACRTMCLSGAGMSGLAKQMEAKRRRTQLWHDDPTEMKRLIMADIVKLQRFAAMEGLIPAVRLNGTSDILWEREGIIQAFPGVQFYDYTKIPLCLRRPPSNYHLTFSVDRANIAQAAEYLEAGHSVAAVVPEHAKPWIQNAWPTAVDGDAHDLRFLDAPGTLVLLKPKGNRITDLVIPDVDIQLAAAMQAPYGSSPARKKVA